MANHRLLEGHIRDSGLDYVRVDYIGMDYVMLG